MAWVQSARDKPTLEDTNYCVCVPLPASLSPNWWVVPRREERGGAEMAAGRQQNTDARVRCAPVQVSAARAVPVAGSTAWLRHRGKVDEEERVSQEPALPATKEHRKQFAVWNSRLNGGV